MTPCMEFTGYLDRNGYGRINRKGCEKYAHRHAWVTAYGPIPPGMCVRHQCDNPGCINPEHLELGSQLDNIADRNNRGRTAIGLRNANAKVTEHMARVILRSDQSSRALAKRLGVSHTTVIDVRRGRQEIAKSVALGVYGWKKLVG